MSGKKILLIEDDADIRLGLEIRLKANGYEVISKGNAGDGMRAVSEKKPDMLILDLGLPDIHGLDVMRMLQGNPATSKLPIIILTAQGTTENFTKALSSENVVTFLEKPVSNDELLATVRVGFEESKK